MRHCFGEYVGVYQSEGESISELLADAAEQAKELEADSYINVHTTYDTDGNYYLTLYAH